MVVVAKTSRMSVGAGWAETTVVGIVAPVVVMVVPAKTKTPAEKREVVVS